MNFFEAIATNPLLMNAVICSLLASFASGIIGSYVVVKRIVLISGSIAHSVLGGIGLCVWLEQAQGISWIRPIYGSIGAALLSALIIGWIRLYHKEREDTVIAAIWSIGMALGVIFISLTPGFTAELTSFLIGNILWVTPEDLTLLTLLDFFLLLIVLCNHKRFLAICFDEEEAKLQGLSVPLHYLLLLALIAITIVLLIQVVGIILVMTMLTIPAALANLFTIRMSMMMLIASILCALFSLSGLMASYSLDWPSGATIALLSGLVYIAGIITCEKWKRFYKIGN